MTELLPRSVLLTGGAGFIGSHMVRHVLELGVHVVTLDALTYSGSLGRLEPVRDDANHTFVRGDIRDETLVAQLLREHAIDAILHLAAESHVDRSIDSPRPFVESNIDGTFVLLEAARRYWTGDLSRYRFHHVSTDEVYGQLGPDDPPFTETSRYLPSSPYSASKAASDHFVHAYHHTYGLPVVITHCSNNFGPYQAGEKFIPTVIRSCVNETPIPVYGNGTNVRDWIHVDDHCRGMLAALRRGRPGRVYNLGASNEWRNIDVVHRICDIVDRLRPRERPHRELIQFVKDRPGHDWRYAIDASRARDELGWQPRADFAAALEATVAWYLEHRSWFA
jgi:dTDP-glucose 4,6-dehydratase